MALTILAVADTISPSLYDHFRPERWGNVDIVLSAGDLPPEYLDYLCSTLNVPVLYVRGNHDGGYAAAQYAGSDDIHERLVTVRGIRIAGFEGCRWYNGGPHQYSEEAMQRAVRRVDRQVRRSGRPQIVLAHAPPAGCHDAADPCHQGFVCFRSAIERWEPAYFVHGHMHAYSGRAAVSVLGSTTVINAYPFHCFEVAEPVKGELARTEPRWQQRAWGTLTGGYRREAIR